MRRRTRHRGVDLATRPGTPFRDREFHSLFWRNVEWRVGLGAIGFLVAGLWWGLGTKVLQELLPVLSNWVEFALVTHLPLVVLTLLFPWSK